MSDYSDILARLRASLVDSGAAVWGTAELDEALLQALTDMNRAALQEYTVSGLAAAVTTTLPVDQFAPLIRGAVAYALLWRAVERVDAFNYQANLSADALAAASAVMQRFEAALAALAAKRTAAMQTTTSTPYPDGTDSAQPGWKLEDDLDTAGG